ncbi:MAG: hypothetical protein PHV34_21210 [Verrucomicrobiae bacterium]|nr:hypothetical protein [Verrucomicrobiae bacterium]
MKFFNRFLVWTILLVGMANTSRGGGQASPLQNLYKSYLASVVSLKNQPNSDEIIAKRKEFHQLWLNKFFSALSSAADSDPGVNQIYYEIIALQTALGKFDDALKVNKALIARETSLNGKLQLVGNLAEIGLLQWEKDPTQDPQVVEKDFENVIVLCKDKVDSLKVLSLYQKYILFEEKLGKYEKAMTLCVQVKKKCSLVAAEQNKDVFSSFSTEWFLAKAAECAFLAGKKNEANDLMNELMKLPKLKFAPSYYFFSFSHFLDPAYGRQFRASAENWLKTRPADAWSQKLQCHLADSYMKDNLYPQAAKLYSQLLEKDLGNPKVGGKNNEDVGYAKQILRNLADALSGMGEKEQSKKLIDSYNAIYGK